MSWHNGPFANRLSAGLALATPLMAYQRRPDAVLLALPRGGVPVAHQLAWQLELPLDLLLVRKLGTPGYSELAMGAVASGNVLVLNDDVIASQHVSAAAIAAEVQLELAELQRRSQAYRADRPLPTLTDKTVLLVDDGVATGATMLAAIQAVRQQQAREIVVAVPVAPADTVLKLQRAADNVVCLLSPTPFRAIGEWYEDFAQVSDDEVRSLLHEAWQSFARQQQQTGGGQ